MFFQRREIIGDAWNTFRPNYLSPFTPPAPPTIFVLPPFYFSASKQSSSAPLWEPYLRGKADFGGVSSCGWLWYSVKVQVLRDFNLERFQLKNQRFPLFKFCSRSNICCKRTVNTMNFCIPTWCILKGGLRKLSCSRISSINFLHYRRASKNRMNFSQTLFELFQSNFLRVNVLSMTFTDLLGVTDT